MQLNNTKFELIAHKPSTENPNLKLLKNLPFFNIYDSYSVTDTLQISPSTFVKDLGIIIDKDLDWKLHVEILFKKCKQISSWILSIFYNRDKYTLITLFNSLILSKVEYGCLIWNPHQIQEINKIEQLQRLFTYKITGMDKYNYWDRLQMLNLMSLQRRRERIIIIHTWKILNNATPNDIDLTFKEHPRTLAIKAVLKPLSKTKGATLTKFEESFTIKAAKLWNVLPPHITRLTNFNIFKINLDKFIRTVPDEPPLPDYPHRNNNSLTNQIPVLKL